MTPAPNPSESRQRGEVQENVLTETALTMRELEAVVGKTAFEQRSEESSSSGQGASGGYSADYSSSDNSSDRSLQNKGFHELVRKLGGLVGLRGESSKEDKAKPRETVNRESSNSDALKTGTGQDNLSEKQTNAVEPLEDSNNGNPQSSAVTPLSEAMKKAYLDQDLPGTKPDTTTLTCGGPLPQWNGVRIQHPMDPRIDISTVQHIMKGNDPGMPILVAQNAAVDTMNAPQGHGVPFPSADHYLNLLEAVRPFFSASGMQMFAPQLDPNVAQPPGGSGSDALSSEGFTSFFTTTNSNTTSSQSTGSGSRPEHVEAASAAANNSVASQQSYSSKSDSDASSMVVLARVKRKHVKRRANQSASSSTTSSEGSKEVALDQEKGNAQLDGDIIGPQEPQEVSQPAGAPQMAPPEEQRESSSTSSSEDRINHGAPQGALHVQQDNAVGLHQYAMPPRIVSESSERNGSSAASNNIMTSTTSGSGSGGNSGSANGSSGSGNEGKGSSTDNAKSENSGGDLNSNSDENNGNKKLGSVATAEHRKTPQEVSAGQVATSPSPLHPPAVSFKASLEVSAELKSVDQQDAEREKRLLGKKRKRMNMRREYEEQVQKQMASSESSESATEIFLRPGKPITLDDVLSVSKMARLLVQATHPFLVVHANAAYGALSGIDCHEVVGKPISALMFIPEPTKAKGSEDRSRGGEITSSAHQGQHASRAHTEIETNTPDSQPSSRGAHASSTLEVASGEPMSLERLMAASGFGRYHVMNVAVKPQKLIVGRNVTIVHEDTVAPENSKAQGASHHDNESQGSNTLRGSMASLSCRICISPVVSSLGDTESAVVTDKDQGGHHHHHHHGKHHSTKRAGDGGGSTGSTSKRRKLQPNEGQFLSSRDTHRLMMMYKETHYRRSHHTTTHFAIQLELVSGTGFREQERSAGSLSSNSTTTTMEARRCGLTKAEAKRRRLARTGVDQDGGGEGAASSANVQDPMMAPPPPPQQAGLRPGNGGQDERGEASDDSGSTKPVVACG